MSQPTRREIADHLVGAARAAGTRFAFGVPGGGSNLDVAGACDRHDVRFVLTHLETSAALMAGVVGELTGAPGIAIGTRGPGATAAANGVANSLLERSPMLMVNDCVAAADAPRVSHQRIDQQAFFESITIASRALNGADNDAYASVVAATLAQPPGPVQIDIDPTSTDTGLVVSEAAPASDPARALALVADARRPVIIAGVGLLTEGPAALAESVEALNLLAARTHTPVLTTYKARGVVPDGSEYTAGIVTGGTIEGHALRDADLIIGLGFDPTELLPPAWTYHAPMVMFNPWDLVDGAYFDGKLAESVVGSMPALIASVAESLTSEWEYGSGQKYWDLLERAARTDFDKATRGLSPAQVVTLARDMCPIEVTATVDAGAHMLVAMPLWRVRSPQRLLISSSHATMGFSLPAAIAAALARPDEPVIAFTGDGGLGMALAELETLARLQLPVVVVVFNDSLLSLIAVKQDPDGHGGSEAVAYRPTDFAAIARACGVASWSVDSASGFTEAMQEALDSGTPALIDVIVDPASYAAVFSGLRD